MAASGFVLILLLAAPSASGASSPPPRAKAEDLKAAFLLKIIRFTRWPTPNHPLRVVVYRGDTMTAPLERAARKVSPGEPAWVVRRARSLAECLPADVVVFDLENPAEIRRVARELASQAVLTVADGEDPAAVECALTFFQESGRLRFALAPDVVERAGLTVSSRLYEIARVRGAARAGAP